MLENEKNLKLPKNRTETQDQLTLIFLNDGKIAIIDTEDLPRVQNYKWRAVKSSRLWYAKTTVGTKPNQVDLSLHRMIARTKPHEVCHHKNRNSMDNRKSNLENMDKKAHSSMHTLNNLIIQYK